MELQQEQQQQGGETEATQGDTERSVSETEGGQEWGEVSKSMLQDLRQLSPTVMELSALKSVVVFYPCKCITSHQLP